jgi:hypothetical protein
MARQASKRARRAQRPRQRRREDRATAQATTTSATEWLLMRPHEWTLEHPFAPDHAEDFQPCRPGQVAVAYSSTWPGHPVGRSCGYAIIDEDDCLGCATEALLGSLSAIRRRHGVAADGDESTEHSHPFTAREALSHA